MTPCYFLFSLFVALVPSCGSHCDNDRAVAATDGGSALIVPSDCLPTAPPHTVTLLDVCLVLVCLALVCLELVCLELVCMVSRLFNPLHCHFRLRLWGPVAQLHVPPPSSCAVYTTLRRRHPRVGVCGCFLWLFVVHFVLYRLCIYTHYIRCLCSASKRLKERIRLEPVFFF